MSIESLVGFTVGVVFIVAVALYMDRHRAEDRDKRDSSHRHA